MFLLKFYYSFHIYYYTEPLKDPNKYKIYFQLNSAESSCPIEAVEKAAAGGGGCCYLGNGSPWRGGALGPAEGAAGGDEMESAEARVVLGLCC